MIHLYPISKLQYTIFDNEKPLSYLKSYGIELARDLEKADFFLSRVFDLELFRRVNHFNKNLNSKEKPFFVWTNEPRFCTIDQETVTDLISVPIHIMNIYTKNVYFSNFTFFGKHIDRTLSPVNEVHFSKIPIAALATRVSKETHQFVLNGLDIDLSLKRQNLIYDGYLMGLVDIYGKKWPDEIRKSESRGVGWQDAKMEILKDYQFNICMENTAFPYYCSEKIWDSIKSYCLPIYSSFNNAIYDVFPKNSFIDYHDFKNNRELLLFVKSISKKEYIDRLNLCISVFNTVYNTIDFDSERRKALDAFIKKIKETRKTN